MARERSFKILIGILFGPKDFPVLRREIISEISGGVEGIVKKELSTLLPRYSMGDFVDLVMCFVTL